MSRGHGKIQRAILAALEPAGTGKQVHQLVEELFPDLPRTAISKRTGQVTVSGINGAESVRRALRKLAAEGLVDREGGRRGTWSLTDPHRGFEEH
jgi:hypothetical protein